MRQNELKCGNLTTFVKVNRGQCIYNSTESSLQAWVSLHC